MGQYQSVFVRIEPILPRRRLELRSKQPTKNAVTLNRTESYGIFILVFPIQGWQSLLNYREFFGSCFFVRPYLFHLGITMFISIFE
jgi:hypothetical protein